MLQIYTGGNSNERMRITSSGSLNIGNASGYTKLIDISKASATDTEVQIRPNDGNAGEARLFIGGGGVNQNKCAIIFDPAGGYCRGNLHFCMDNTGDTSDVDSTDKKLTVQADGDVEVNTGNLVIGTAGKGIDFGATANATATGVSMSHEIFDDYEEGNWTPFFYAWIGGGVPATHDIQYGKYTKIGRVVHIVFDLKGDRGNMGNNYINVGGLPFAHLGSNAEFSSIKRFLSLTV